MLLLENPCSRCASPELESEFVGSGYCSLICLLKDRDGEDKDKTAYARMMLAHLIEHQLSTCPCLKSP
jgi:hypothetical protein